MFWIKVETKWHLRLSFKLLGNGEDYLSLAIKDGGIALAISLGSEKLSTKIMKKNLHFHDDVWHQVVIRRVAKQVGRLLYKCWILIETKPKAKTSFSYNH